MKSIKNKLTLAACTLLSQHSGSALAIENAWEIDSSLLYYDEADDRVSVAKLVGTVSGDVSDTDRVTILTVLDTMSGATPSGAVKSKDGSVTFTSASGGGGATIVDANANPLVKFDDTRLANSITWQHTHDNNWTLDYNGAISIENDYRSFSAAITANKETAQKDYKYTFGIAGTYDQIFRVGAGSTPVPLTQIADNEFAGDGEKTTTDLILGLTHTVNRRTVVQANLSYSLSTGYLTDPYKVFSVVDRATDVQITDSSYYESRPDSRQRLSATFLVNHQTYPNNNVIHGSYRFYTDDWDVNSHTFDFKYRINNDGVSYVEPSIRLYQQDQASFYQNQFYIDNTGGVDPATLFPKHISADYRLDDMHSITPGIRYGKEVGKDGKLRIRLDYMIQKFKNSDFDENKAIILQLAYSKRF